jgi:hypothetical protein
MDGIGLPIAALLLGALLSWICETIRLFRRFRLAALVSPFLASVVFLFGSWIVSDMNPCAEYDLSCVPPGGHDATGEDVSLWLLSVAATFLLSALICVRVQKAFKSRKRRDSYA